LVTVEKLFFEQWGVMFGGNSWWAGINDAAWCGGVALRRLVSLGVASRVNKCPSLLVVGTEHLPPP